MKKRVITLSILSGFLIFSFINCLSIVSPEKTGTASKKSIKIGKWNEEDSKFPENFESGGRIDIAYKYNHRSTEVGFWGIIGMFNLCVLIPCVDKYLSEITIDYSANGQKISSEIIKANSYAVVSAIPLLPYSIIFPNDDEKNFETKFINKIIPYIQNSIPDIEKKLLEIEKNREIAYKEIMQLPDSKCKPLYESRGKNYEIFTKEQQDETWNKFQSCVEKKLISAISKKYSFLKKHLKKEILFEESSSTYELVDLFNAKYLSVIPDTGRKLKDSEFYIKKINDRSFSLNMHNNRDIVKFDFEIQNDKLYCTSMEAGRQINPNNWEYFAQLLFKSLYSYPEGDHWDWDFLDSN
jgi:hypothetical protein